MHFSALRSASQPVFFLLARKKEFSSLWLKIQTHSQTLAFPAERGCYTNEQQVNLKKLQPRSLQNLAQF